MTNFLKQNGTWLLACLLGFVIVQYHQQHQRIAEFRKEAKKQLEDVDFRLWKQEKHHETMMKLCERANHLQEELAAIREEHFKDLQCDIKLSKEAIALLKDVVTLQAKLLKERESEIEKLTHRNERMPYTEDIDPKTTNQPFFFPLRWPREKPLLNIELDP